MNLAGLLLHVCVVNKVACYFGPRLSILYQSLKYSETFAHQLAVPMIKGWPSNALSLGNQLQGESGWLSWLPALSYLIHQLPEDRRLVKDVTTDLEGSSMVRVEMDTMASSQGTPF